MTTPTWFGRAPLHAAVISCWVLPFAKARTRSPRVEENRFPPAGIAATVRGRRRDRAGVAAFAAVIGVLADVILFAPVPFAVAQKHTLGGFQFAELAGEPLALRIDARER